MYVLNLLLLLLWSLFPLLLAWELACCLWLRVAPLTSGEELAPWVFVWDTLGDVCRAEEIIRAGLWAVGYPCLLLARLRFRCLWNRLERAGLVCLNPEHPVTFVLNAYGLP